MFFVKDKFIEQQLACLIKIVTKNPYIAAILDSNSFSSCNNWYLGAIAIGLNKIDGKINVYAPYGLSDLFGMALRPNKPSVIKWVYEKKVETWAKRWPNLKIIPWD